MLSIFKISLSWALFLRLFVLFSNYIDQVTRPDCVRLRGSTFNNKYIIDINLIELDSMERAMHIVAEIVH